MDPLVLLAALGPILGRAANAAVDRWISRGDVKAATVAEAVELSRLRIEEFRALNDAGAQGDTYPWVNAIIRLQRPLIVVAIGALALWQVATVGDVSPAVQNALGAVGAYLFMDRTLFHARRAPER